eukprot:TRINITY_DN1845_c0_g1_i1.p1 TRINITY_DN1845_c0_g1~~TRINITY_DN1845_c0_g1_i1.p1  ORF type:complete len:131 (-),score=40.09 TRINITY_DN1845_c0_g1_i1:76-468(-)
MVQTMPNIKHLSLLKNEACPNYLTGGTARQYADYRQYVISRLHRLETLDTSAVTAEERADAVRVYGGIAAIVSSRQQAPPVPVAVLAKEDEDPPRKNKKARKATSDGSDSSDWTDNESDWSSDEERPAKV